MIDYPCDMLKYKNILSVPRVVLYAFLFMLFSSPCMAQQVFVRGYVLDVSNNGLESVSVSAIGTSQGTTTNSNGYYQLSINVQDADTIVFFSLGYKDKFVSLPSTIDKAININVVLEQDTSMLQGVYIRELRRESGTTNIVDTKVLRLTPDASGGVESLVKMQLGVNSTNELSSQYSVRGGSFDENSVYVNGVEVYRPMLIHSSQQEGLSFINPDLVGKVSFSAGGFDAKYGDKMSSVLDIEYKRPTNFEGNFTAGLMGATAYIGYGNDKFTMTHGIRYKTNQYLLSDKLRLKNGKALLKGIDTKGDFNNFFIDYQTFIGYKLNDKISLSFLGNVSENRYNFVPKSRVVQFGTATMQREFTVSFYGSEKDRFLSLFGATALEYRPTKALKLKLTASSFNSLEAENYDLIGAYSLSAIKYDGKGNRNADFLGSGLFHEHARNRLSVWVANIIHSGILQINNSSMEWGVSVGNEVVDDNIHEYERRDSAQYSMPNNGKDIKMVYNLYSKNATNSIRLQGFLQHNFKFTLLNSKWQIGGGVRANYWGFNREWLLSPRLNANCTPRWQHNLTIRMALGIYYQSPFYKEIRQTITDKQGSSYIHLNRDIKAQRSAHILTGVDYYFRMWHRPFKFTTEIYYKPADRIIPYSVDNVRIRYVGQNIAVANTAGIDCKLFGEFVPGVDSWISLSYMNSKEDIIGDSYSVYTNKGTYLGDVYPSYIPRPNEQRYSFSLFFQDYIPNHPDYKLNLKLVWADGFPFGPSRAERYKAIYRTKPYRRVDIGASRGFEAKKTKLLQKQKLIKAIWLHLDLLNLFNIKNESSYYWVSDISGYQWAVPNYLTNFMVNFRVSVDF